MEGESVSGSGSFSLPYTSGACAPGISRFSRFSLADISSISSRRRSRSGPAAFGMSPSEVCLGAPNVARPRLPTSPPAIPSPSSDPSTTSSSRLAAAQKLKLRLVSADSLPHGLLTELTCSSIPDSEFSPTTRRQ